MISKNKKGSHVGIILSFVIFITFAAFLFSIIQPQLKQEKSKQASLEFLRELLIDEFKANLTTITIKESSSGISGQNDNCLDYSPPSGLAGMNAYMINSQGEGVPFIKSSGTYKIKFLNTQAIKISFSEESFNAPPSDGINGQSVCLPSETVLQKEDKEIFKSKIQKINDSFDTFKESVKLPPGTDFNFKFIDQDENEITPWKGEILSNVYSDEIPILYIDYDSKLKSGRLIVDVW